MGTIIATIGPASCTPQAIKAIRKAGMTVARLNLAHANLGWHRLAVDAIREHAPEVAIQVDLPGDRLAGKNGMKTHFRVDLNNVAFASEHADRVGWSYARCRSDLERARDMIGDRILVAKIETPEGIRNKDEIADVADALSVDRGDLAEHVSMENMPGFVYALVEYANLRSMPITIATGVLASMRHMREPAPAEACDIVGLMRVGDVGWQLSEETAIGVDPANAVRMLRSIATCRQRC